MSEYYKPQECDWCRIFGEDEAINTKCNHVILCDQCGTFCDDACPHDFFLCGNCCMDNCKSEDDEEPPRTNPHFDGNVMYGKAIEWNDPRCWNPQAINELKKRFDSLAKSIVEESE